eukprot:m.5562 g.5562  ORF g.5562 m.5562 type:complete len:241 (+) comp3332_c0_seq2:222-944(+)
MAGVRARRAREQRAAALAAKKAELEDLELSSMREQLEAFKINLEKFAEAHRKEIKKHPHFRKSFQSMCDIVGVDPLASQKGFWSQLLGLGDFYYELGVQVVEACLSTRSKNGGLMNLDDLLTLVSQRRGSASDISTEDICRAIDKLKVLGSGFHLHTLDNGQTMVQSVPVELSADHATIFSEASSNGGHLSVGDLALKAGWEHSRAQNILEELVQEGFAWVDDQSVDGLREYWFPSIAAR